MTKRRNFFASWIVPFLLAALSTPLMAQKDPSAEELAKKTQNPVADLISVPLQNNFNFGAGFHHNRMIYILNVQPVIPINLNEEWNLITRIIMPIINQPNLFPSFGGVVPSTMGTGFGDFNPTFFLSPAKPGELIWGVGPTFTLPTATDRNLGAGKWSMGPASDPAQGHLLPGGRTAALPGILCAGQMKPREARSSSTKSACTPSQKRAAAVLDQGPIFRLRGALLFFIQ